MVKFLLMAKEGIISLEGIINKMTQRTAERFNIKNRVPASHISESEFKEFKYFAVYEYTTDKGRAFYLLEATRSLNGPTK